MSSQVVPIEMDADTEEREGESQRSPLRSKLMAIAAKCGLVNLGWTVRDYMTSAAVRGKFCLCHIWGEQGNMKSNFTLQMGSWIYGEKVGDEWHPDWDAVLKHLVFRPGKEERGLLAFVKSIPYGEREAWVGWDDLGVHYPSTIYRTEMEKYQAVDATFAAIRTKVSTMTTNNPLIDRVAKNIKDNITIEVWLTPNQTLMAERLCRIPSRNTINSFFFKVLIEGPYIFDWTKVPKDVWDEYWELRLRIADEAIQLLDQAYSEEGELVPVSEAVKECPPGKLLTYVSKGLVTVIRKGNSKFISKEDLEIVKRAAQESAKSRKVA